MRLTRPPAKLIKFIADKVSLAYRFCCSNTGPMKDEPYWGLEWKNSLIGKILMGKYLPHWENILELIKASSSGFLVQ